MLFENYSKEQLFEIFNKIDFNSILDLAYETYKLIKGIGEIYIVNFFYKIYRSLIKD